MSDSITSASTPSAGAQLRKARETQRLPIEALAAALKVPPQKLKLLEADRFGELPDPAFARALAQTVCRYLKIEPAPVLALLPPAAGNRIANLTEGLNQPFRERAPDGFNWQRVSSPAVWAPLLLLLAAGWLYLAPPELLSRLKWSPSASSDAPGDAAPNVGSPGGSMVTEVLRAPAANEPAPSAGPPVAVQPAFPTAAPVPAPPPVAAAAASDAPAAADALVQIDASAESWVEVIDADGRSLIARTVRPGETVRLDGTRPLKVKIGNAEGVVLRFHGEPVDLVPSTRGSVARLRLK